MQSDQIANNAEICRAHRRTAVVRGLSKPVAVMLVTAQGIIFSSLGPLRSLIRGSGADFALLLLALLLRLRL
ncbi:hypothetical protein Micbo1qcDRAFT_170103, partial [Microdochium bolleyi]